MKRYVPYFVIIALAFWSNSFAQYPDWINYTNGQDVNALADNGNELWIGAGQGGLVKLDKTTGEMIFYNRANSGLPHNDVSALAIDGNNLWIGTGRGLAKFDGSNWTVYNTSNSGMPDDWVFALVIDVNDNTWIGTWLGGLAVYREGGVILNIEQESGSTIVPSTFLLSQNYPNPFNPSTIIKYGIPQRTFVELGIYDILGREVEFLVKEEQEAGYYEINLDASKLSSGIYLYCLQAGDFIQTKKMILLK